MRQNTKRLTLEELSSIVESSVKMIINESRAVSELTLAQKELVKIGDELSRIALRLKRTPFQRRLKDIYDGMARLNDELIRHIKGEGEV